MINAAPYVRDEFYTALTDASINAHKEDVPEAESEAYVLIRIESETNRSNARHFVWDVIAITDAVVPFHNSINMAEVDTLDGEVRAALKERIGSTFAATADLQFVSLRPETTTYLSEDDGTKKYGRKITRWAVRVTQLST